MRHLIDGVSAATWLSLLTGLVIPFLSALVTKVPSFLTGVVTALLAAVSGFAAQWATNGTDFDLKGALGTALGTWAVAALTHSKVLAHTGVEDALQGRGVSGSNILDTPDPDPDPESAAAGGDLAEAVSTPAGPVTAGAVGNTPRPVSDAADEILEQDPGSAADEVAGP